jgi:hypothetical protein
MVSPFRHHIEEERISGVPMQLENFSFGSLTIDGKTYENDIVIDRGEIRKRKKTFQAVSRQLRSHAALNTGEDPLEMSSARDRHGSARQAADHG